ncbi:hypothetical protein BO83DRAFT_176422 [Aspergillus eucalypticola CBS 122712]|uniref:Uncharacterized protein n=1 Tax=Aspergillus eucalypticola (strain CBS 122712 / IBT 29274) TaxID=1448314 RepID=A0A317W486_ASPEC|nr:uncharacterized protein BO83DRAFT_176422 [Aspergillus eucalypticola CBS 122712]PWY81416.1 hypothetical protein BO83DRAFT_176422 [Aspergillus eucalypticola CBS 122712]
MLCKARGVLEFGSETVSVWKDPLCLAACRLMDLSLAALSLPSLPVEYGIHPPAFHNKDIRWIPDWMSPPQICAFSILVSPPEPVLPFPQ